MDLTKLSEKFMAMDETTWHRHSNPWSVYSRFTMLPLISLAFWSREWLGVYSIIVIILSFIWVWLNPRLFTVPDKTNNWASMGTFGERIYLNRKERPIPKHHVKPAIILLVMSGLGVPIFIYGLYSLNFFVLVLGNVWIIAFKAWFVDRMVWLYLDMKDSDSQYMSWLKL
jgi:hypothetical protein